MLGSLPRAHVGEFLSGLLIGAEVATLSQRFRDQQVTIVAGETLGEPLSAGTERHWPSDHRGVGRQRIFRQE